MDNDNWTAITAIFTIIIALATVASVCITRKLVEVDIRPVLGLIQVYSRRKEDEDKGLQLI